jgi:hypothetical protein
MLKVLKWAAVASVAFIALLLVVGTFSKPMTPLKRMEIEARDCRSSEAMQGFPMARCREIEQAVRALQSR